MDRARKWTDARLAKMERHIKNVYMQARDEITEKWNAYMERGRKRLVDLYAAYKSAPLDKKAEALKRYQDAAQNYTLRNRWYREMVNQTTYRLAHANEIAIDYANGKIPEIYVENFNPVDPQLQDIGINWSIRDERMVRNLFLDSLPQKKLNYAKDMAWNARQINSSVLQGILQGESIDAIAKRILPIVDNNKVAAIRAARTMVTGAENRGRFDRYGEYESMGVVMSRVWIATPDKRTRPWHLSMDGQEAASGEPFIDGHGNELDFPGDTSHGAPGDTIYNCRCSMRSHILGMRRADGAVTSLKNYRMEKSFHEKQIESERGRRRRDV